MSAEYLHQAKDYFLDLQNTLCEGLEKADGKASFIEDDWQHHEGGGGLTKVMTDGAVFEKGGVNFSHVHGEALPASATAARPELAGRSFHATGVSLVLHPENPFIPTVHANWRFFMAEKAKENPIWWFGGGMDLTPYYGFEEDCLHWHHTIKHSCDSCDEHYYRRFKQWCDEYFYLKHRDEHRGIGGIFFDDLNDKNFDHCLNFIKTNSKAFLPSYLPIVEKRRQQTYTQAQKAFQCYRRGRYVEFNLVYDRGTLFGLQSNGRTESILMSLPPIVHWHYNLKPTPGSEEEKLTNYFLQPKDWVTDEDIVF